MFKFKYTGNLNERFDRNVEVKFDVETLTDLADHFKAFLLACGFHPESIKRTFTNLDDEDELYVLAEDSEDEDDVS